MQGSLTAQLDGVFPLDLTETAKLYDETRLLSRLVDDLRELAQAEAGQLQLNIGTIDLKATNSKLWDRGTRIISATDLLAVTPEAVAKTHFVIVDAVGVCESDKTDSRPLERKPTVSFGNLLLGVALGKRDEDTLTTLAGRLARRWPAKVPQHLEEVAL